MQSSLDLSGLGVALITPFTPQNAIDFNALSDLIDYQISGGVDYIVVLGTTAETPTLSIAERAEVRDFVAKKVAGRVPLVLGCGGNCTRTLLEEIEELEDVARQGSYQAILSVVPFYNKPTQAGIYAHYAAIAASSPLPVVLYNVPGRTGVNMTAETTLRLAREFSNIIAVKEASGNMAQVTAILAGKPDGFQVLSGDDALALPMMAMGASGVISVAGNAFPVQFSRLINLIREGKYDQAQPLNLRFAELYRLLFAEGNPAGIKSALASMGKISNTLRLPLVPVSEPTAEAIAARTAKVFEY